MKVASDLVHELNNIALDYNSIDPMGLPTFDDKSMKEMEDAVAKAIEMEKLKERHIVLMDLWEPNSKAKVHLRISKMLDETIAKLNLK
jgi:hypothetical protein